MLRLIAVRDRIPSAQMRHVIPMRRSSPLYGKLSSEPAPRKVFDQRHATALRIKLPDHCSAGPCHTRFARKFATLISAFERRDLAYQCRIKEIYDRLPPFSERNGERRD